MKLSTRLLIKVSGRCEIAGSRSLPPAYRELEESRRPLSDGAGPHHRRPPDSALKIGRSVACQFDCSLSPLR
jgi:hypothetical protein